MYLKFVLEPFRWASVCYCHGFVALLTTRLRLSFIQTCNFVGFGVVSLLPHFHFPFEGPRAPHQFTVSIMLMKHTQVLLAGVCNNSKAVLNTRLQWTAVRWTHIGRCTAINVVSLTGHTVLVVSIQLWTKSCKGN